MLNIKVILIAIALIISLSFSFAQNTGGKIAVMPFDVNGIDEVYVETTESILRVELSKQSSKLIASEDEVLNVLDNSACKGSECVLEVGKRTNSTQVLSIKLSALGKKTIIQYYLLDAAANKNLLVDQLTITQVEELETAMKRIAKSVVDLQPLKQGAEVGNILENESQPTYRKASRKNVGLAFGYLYPQSGYDGNERTFLGDLRLDYEMEDFSVGMLLGIRRGFAANVYGHYLFTRTDICPYIGGGFGFHWVSHDDIIDLRGEDKNADGFELTINTGLRLLHTYSFQIILNLEFIATFNDYNDKAIVFTIGFL